MIEPNNIYCDDCFNILKDIPDKYFDLLLIDPPYGIFSQKNFSSRGESDKQKCQWSTTGETKLAKPIEYPKIDWDNELSQEQVNELFRVSKNQIIFGFEHLYQKLPKSRGIYCWDKKRGSGTTFSEFELVWTSFDFPAKFIRFMWNGMFRDSWEVEENIKFHPTQKPLEIIKLLLKNHSKEGDLVLDCFNGSGTTTLACKQLNRRFVGIEVSKYYCDVANDRLRQCNLNDFIR